MGGAHFGCAVELFLFGTNGIDAPPVLPGRVQCSGNSGHGTSAITTEVPGGRASARHLVSQGLWQGQLRRSFASFITLPPPFHVALIR